MKLKNNQQGFTLIEMMVVIAVVGILSAAVLAGLGPSRAKARDARVISGLNQIRTIAETVYDPTSNDPYSTLTTAAASVTADIATQGNPATITPTSDKFGFAASAKLPSNDKLYCVDSSGFSGLKENAAAGTPCSDVDEADIETPTIGLAKDAVCVVPAVGAPSPCATGLTCLATDAIGVSGKCN